MQVPRMEIQGLTVIVHSAQLEATAYNGSAYVETRGECLYQFKKAADGKWFLAMATDGSGYEIAEPYVVIKQ